MKKQFGDLSGLSKFAAISLVLCAFFWPMAAAAEEPEYPIVFTDATELTRLGIALQHYGKNGDKVKPFRNRCYYYGDGGLDLSVSDKYLESHKARGFSLNSLCMALASGITHDPETGVPLPTYIVVDLEVLKKQGTAAEPGVVSDILPLDVPDCFKRGLPYSDCDIKYDPMSGEKLCEQITRHFRRVGKAVEDHFDNLIKSGEYDKECGCKDEQTKVNEQCRREKYCSGLVSGMLAPESNWFHGDLPGFGAYTPNHHISFFDISSSLPQGFGYALFAQGGAGPSASPDSVSLALDGKHRATEQEIQDVAKKIQKK